MGAETGPEWILNGNRNGSEGGPKMGIERARNGPQMVAKTDPEWTPDGSRHVPGMDPSWDPKWIPNEFVLGSAMDRKRIRFGVRNGLQNESVPESEIDPKTASFWSLKWIPKRIPFGVRNGPQN